MFLDNELLNEAIGIENIREYIWFSETKLSKPEKKEEDNEFYLGSANNTGYYFFYEKDMMTTLDERFLRTIKTKEERYTIYADNCLLDDALIKKHHIIFKKIPRDITRF